ncbi:MAG: YsnF/AvaK domain-containing protein [Vulcanimicrobiaceae bacterium]
MFDSVDNAPHESALVATFPDRETAHQAVHRLHDEGFHNTWIGLTRSMTDDGGAFSPSGATTETRVEEDNALARFFGGGNESLHAALRRHGVSEADAARVDTTLPANCAILTVHGSNHPELAAQIVAECGGEMVTSAASSRLLDTYGDRKEKARNDSRDAFASLGNYGAGKELAEERKLQLREERLSVDKRRVSAGEAVVGKKVVTEKADIDVPLVHEELYIERRPASGTYAGAIGSIGDGESIHVPLSRDEVDIQKRTVVTEEVAVGQRRVEETKHVSETLRKEELDIDKDATGDRAKRGLGTSDRL